MRLLLLTLEYNVGTFSGNGTYAQALVRSLRAAGHTVSVLCGAPPEWTGPSPDGEAWPVSLPTWEWGALVAACEDVRAWALRQEPVLVLGVDFSSLNVYRALRFAVPLVHLNWRVYSMSDFAHVELERDMLATSVLAIALCQADAAYLRTLRSDIRVAVVSPPLRAEAQRAALEPGAAQAWAAEARPLLTCAVRLSAEKQPERFVALVEAMALNGALQRCNLTPCLVGRARDAYGAALLARLRAAAPDAEVYDGGFLSPAEMGAIFARTRLNVHPCSADAFGMTIVEAAAFSSPSLAHRGSQVGATEVVTCVVTDMEAPAALLARKVEEIVANGEALAKIAHGHAQALAWTEERSAAALVAELVMLYSSRESDSRNTSLLLATGDA
jgi:glycosyltransferase involved in cell wall biosynthesis